MKKLLKKRSLLIFLIGLFISGLGTRLTTIALSDKALSLTGSDQSINLVFMFQSLPIMIFGLFAGSIVDKTNKKISIIITNLIFACTSAIFALGSNMKFIYLIIIINGVILSFYMPARIAMLPLIVREDELTEANGLRMSINGVIEVIGYAAAGIVVRIAGSSAAFLLDSLSFIILAFMFIFIRTEKEHRVKKLSGDKHNKKAYKEEMKEAWIFIRGNRYVKIMFFLHVLTNFIISMQIPLSYIFVEKFLGGKALMAERTGYIFAAAGIGGIAGGIILTRFRKVNKIFLLAVSLIFDSLLVLGFSVNRFFVLSVIIFGAMGVVGSFTGSIMETVIQQNTPDYLIGRVSGFISSIVEPVNVLSILAGTAAMSLIRVDWIFILGALSEMAAGIYFTISERKNMKSAI